MFFLIASLFLADIQVVNGVAYECKDGICMPLDAAEPEIPVWDETPEESEEAEPRLKLGYMGKAEFLSFLRNEEPEDDALDGKSLWAILVLVLLGGLAMNLTPCVLPMIPINLMIIGKSFKNGLAYGFGIALSYGALGLAASLGGMAFGQIQGSPWFNLAVSAVFLALALSMFGAFFIDFSKYRFNSSSAFVMGMLSAVLAGACVAPILISVLFLTARLVAEGSVVALGLPFVLGLGMALPWPLLGAGMHILPKPGAWMGKVNKIFGLIVLGFAGWYGYLGVTGLMGAPKVDAGMTVDDFALPMERPVLVDCWATWCKNCAAMERTTLQDPEVVAELERFTVIRLQSEDISKLKALPGFESVQGLPAFVIFE
jgi:thiol:disulfide interchange protein